MQIILPSHGFVPPGAPDVFNLLGSASVPRGKINEQAAGDVANVVWLIGCVDVPGLSIVKGEMQHAGFGTVGPPESYLSVDQGVEGVWVVPHDFSNTYYVRATLASGDNPTSGSGVDVWLSLVSEGANRSWKWTQGPASGTQEGILKLELSDDSNGDNILATGHYRGRATVAQP